MSERRVWGWLAAPTLALLAVLAHGLFHVPRGPYLPRPGSKAAKEAKATREAKRAEAAEALPRAKGEFRSKARDGRGR